jgi:hypothetical protein
VALLDGHAAMVEEIAGADPLVRAAARDWAAELSKNRRVMDLIEAHLPRVGGAFDRRAARVMRRLDALARLP